MDLPSNLDKELIKSIEVKNIDPENIDLENNLDLKIDLNNKKLLSKSASMELRIYLTPHQMKRIKQLEKKFNISTKEVIIKLLDFYYFQSFVDLSFVVSNLTTRIEKGVDRSFITQLKVIYTFIGHFLKKIKYL